MIRYIHIRNFKSLADTGPVELGPFTVLVGKNGSGKSSFLQAIEVLSWLVQRESINDALMRNEVNFADIVHLRAPSRTIELSIELGLPSTASRQAATVSYTTALKKKHFVYVHFEALYPGKLADFPNEPDLKNWPYAVARIKKKMIAKEGKHVISYDNVSLPHSILRDVLRRPYPWKEFPVLSEVAREMNRFRHFEIWGPKELRNPSNPRKHMIDKYGANLPSAIRFLRKRDGYASLIGELARVYPWLSDIRIHQDANGRLSMSFLERPQQKAKKTFTYNARQVSDGFLETVQ